VTGHPLGGYMIGFGTGKYLELSDVSTTGLQTFYGIWDNNTNINSRSSLIEQTILDIQTVGSYKYRISSLNSVDYSSSNKGWFMDLPESGERVDVNPVIRDGRFVFVTRTPSSLTCTAGGSSWLMEIDYLTGGRLDISPFDVDSDGSISNSDFLTLTITKDDGTTEDIQVPVSGVSDGGGMQSTPTVLETDDSDEEYKILVDSDGQIKSVLESAKTGYRGRVSWEEIR
jgi:type IV pilus assembly protein PilY1